MLVYSVEKLCLQNPEQGALRCLATSLKKKKNPEVSAIIFWLAEQIIANVKKCKLILSGVVTGTLAVIDSTLKIYI